MGRFAAISERWEKIWPWIKPVVWMVSFFILLALAIVGTVILALHAAIGLWMIGAIIGAIVLTPVAFISFIATSNVLKKIINDKDLKIGKKIIGIITTIILLTSCIIVSIASGILISLLLAKLSIVSAILMGMLIAIPIFPIVIFALTCSIALLSIAVFIAYRCMTYRCMTRTPKAVEELGKGLNNEYRVPTQKKIEDLSNEEQGKKLAFEIVKKPESKSEILAEIQNQQFSLK